MNCEGQASTHTVLPPPAVYETLTLIYRYRRNREDPPNRDTIRRNGWRPAVNFRTDLFLAVTTVAGLLFIGSPSSASQFLDIDVGPYRFNVPADSFGVPQLS
jgi:hypothetical protein